MKKFTAEATYSVPAARVREIQTSEEFVDFLAARFAGEVGAEVRSRSVVQEGDVTVATATVHVSPDSLPSMAGRLLPQGADVTITQRWNAPAPDGSHTGEFLVGVRPDKGSMRADFVLRDTGEGSRREYDGQLSVNVPLVGGAIENKALGYTDRLMGIERRVLELYLDEHGK